MTGSEDHWFEYTRTAGRFSAAPLNWKGWAALIVTLGVTIASGMVLGSLAAKWGPIAHFITLVAVILAGTLLIVRLVLTKGKAAQ